MGNRQHERTATQRNQPAPGTGGRLPRAMGEGGDALQRPRARRDVIAPGHQRWDEFVARFFRLRSLGPGMANTTRILWRLGHVDVENSLAALRTQGAYDDHDVFLNLVRRARP